MYFYHADAVALGGTFLRPVPDFIEPKAACSVPSRGGNASARSGPFDYNGISFTSAESSITGGVENRNGTPVSVTRVSLVVEGLNVMHMVTANRIVARLAAEHKPDQDEPEIITTGCHFDGLKIAGHGVEVETDHNLFSRFPTFSSWQAAWQGGGTDKASIEDSLMGKRLPADVAATRADLLEVHDGFTRQGKTNTLRRVVLSSFVKNVTGINGQEIGNWGPVITVPQFGTIYLGEVIVSHSQRRVHMLRLELGSPDQATFVAASATSNGVGYP